MNRNDSVSSVALMERAKVSGGPEFLAPRQAVENKRSKPALMTVQMIEGLLGYLMSLLGDNMLILAGPPVTSP